MQEIRFSITPALQWEQAVLAMHRAQGWSAYLQPLGYATLIIVLARVPRYCSSCDLDDWSFTQGLCAMYLGKLTFDFFFIRYITKMYAAPNGMTLGERRLHADDHSIIVEGTHYKSVYSWSAIQGVSTGKRILVLWTDNGSGVIIPKSAFKFAAELDEFISKVEAKIPTKAKREQ